MADRPDEKPRWATEYRFSSITNNPNVVEPTESKKNVGWDPFEPPARNYFNWLALKTYQWIDYLDYLATSLNKVSDGAGENLFDVENTLIELVAVDKVTPANFLKAVGWKGTVSHTLNVIDSNTLTLGAQDANGTQAISGGTAANIVVYAKMILPPA